MFNLVRSLYHRIARAWIVLFSLLLTIVGLAAFSTLDTARPAGSPGAVALQLAFSKEAFTRIIAEWGPAGVRAYQRSTLGLDYLFPIAYALCLASSIAWLASRPGREPDSVVPALFGLPWVAAALDWIENTLHLILLGDVHHPSASLVLLASIAAAIKWGLIAFSVLVVLYLILRNIEARRAIDQ